ncbi:crotonase/enoyl-CoA hydratase family protein [Epibacterium sp. SM1969]|uniref:Crotonase/enoyl-CoA hydratase family protein n=1 Tax=Tritonibacter aquimaris TaxID=2663379 RepID=A0A844AJS7_9RHOB|nr:crotonase/enoyl-CoA hydratase family protein [Tritonibacter aquimaris]MQY41089.1 crotonase/enoyl-CoA hydratase family protein [Tritonibacter aquimaris]
MTPFENLETLLLDVDARGVATVTLNRPDKHNALSAQMIAELSDVADWLAQERAVRVVVLAANGKSFCAGGDLGWMQAQVDANQQVRESEARKLAEMLQRWNELPKAVIAAVQGNAFGGGVGMISVCDIAIASHETKFALTETRLGLIPATIGPYIVARMGEVFARRVILSGRIFDANEAVRFNLLAQTVAGDSLSLAVEKEVEHHLQSAPLAVADSKKLLQMLGSKGDTQNISRTIEALSECWAKGEAEAGIRAFFAKELPAWRK